MTSACRRYLTSSSRPISLRRSYLYVPAASERMLEKSLETESDVIIYDLEDSVALPDKYNARKRLVNFLSRPQIPQKSRIAVRLNDIHTPFFAEDLAAALHSKRVDTLILPKIQGPQDLDYVSDKIQSIDGPSVNLVASIESARALFDIGSIAAWKSQHGKGLGGSLSSLLFASEDYCADTLTIRSRNRTSLLHARASIVVASKAFGLSAIDMVCIYFKDTDKQYLLEECIDGRELGFDGKQAIHPSQVATIQSTFVPTEKDIERAVKIVHQMEIASKEGKGAIGIGNEMIDAPMVKQAQRTLDIAKAANLAIPAPE